MNPAADERVKEAQSEADKNELVAWAAARGLLADGADPHVKDKNGRYPVHFAASQGHTDVVQHLATRGVDLDCEDPRGRTPLHYAALGGHLDVVQFLVKKGVWLDGYDDGDDTALHLAARKGDAAVVRALLGGGAKMELANKRSLTPLGEATIAGHVEVVQALLDKGANPSCRSRGFTLLHLAAGTGQAAVLQLLLRSGGSPLALLVTDASNEEQATPLHAAATAGSLASAENLLREGADASACNAAGQTAAELVVLPDAADKGHAAAKKLKELLQKEAAKKGPKPVAAKAPATAASTSSNSSTAVPAAAATGAKPKGILKNKGEVAPAATSSRGPSESESSYAKQFNKLTQQEQLRKVGQLARLDDKELGDHTYLSKDALEAIVMIRQMERVKTCYSAMLALRKDEDFQEGLRDPALMAAIDHIKITNSLDKYRDSPSILRVLAKLKKLRAVFQENGDMKVNLDDVRFEGKEKLAEDEEKLATLERNLIAAKMGAIDAITGVPGSALKKKGGMLSSMEEAMEAVREETDRPPEPAPTTWKGKAWKMLTDIALQIAAMLVFAGIVLLILWLAGNAPWSVKNMTRMMSKRNDTATKPAKIIVPKKARDSLNPFEGMEREL